ncbi:hypothetical protein C8F04DRAFT_1269135 [Mycena alexandri]|uniref:Reverse transcriptase zinc-binding domain-containing protein n=1 Tax=Mycena alexandri TaxID=1745969 RepID=A0AAD6SCT1_9AGAR|nr:hypothetical protein C8F04DRAFT_1269135 [Mycena alexandri]
MYDGLTRPQCSVLTQLRTGHIGLHAHLHKIQVSPTPNCATCPTPETVNHFLLLCPAYRQQRLKLIIRLGTARLTLRRLLAAKSEHKAVFEFVRDTGRLPRYQL